MTLGPTHVAEITSTSTLNPDVAATAVAVPVTDPTGFAPPAEQPVAPSVTPNHVYTKVDVAPVQAPVPVLGVPLVPLVVGPTKSERVKAFLKGIAAKVSPIATSGLSALRTYAYEVFLVAIVFTLAAFVIIFPKVALWAGAVVSAVSGWIAYAGLNKRIKNG